jgi:hypothetical protein
MVFSRTYRYLSTLSADDIRRRLTGQHMKVHNLDFEVTEKGQMLRIIPHAEEVESVKTLPITHVDFRGRGNKTQVVISAKMRRIDRGGPMLVVIFCLFLIIAGIIAFLVGRNAEYSMYAYVLLGIGAFIFLIFWMRMETGYFDYVRKIRNHIKQQSVA